MTASTARLPGNASRTSTQAMSVPITALITPTASALSTVSRIAATAAGLLTASQNPDQPPPNPFTTTAASGNSTSRLSQSTATPNPVPDRAPSRTRPGATERARAPARIGAECATVTRNYSRSW